MKKKKMRYIFGKRLDCGNKSSINVFEFNMPSIARVLDGINFFVNVKGQVPINTFIDSGKFNFYVNNELVIESGSLQAFSLVYITSANSQNNLEDPYKPTPRPLSGYDQIRVEFFDCPWNIGKLNIDGANIHINIHYQPKQ